MAHPVEVSVAQEAHLLRWLSKRLGRQLAAPDLAAFGYRLMGGRLRPAGSAAAAQLIYEDASGKRLPVYVRAADGTETAFRFQQEGDAATFAWIDQGFGFAVTATAGRDELLPIAEAVYKGLTSEGLRRPATSAWRALPSLKVGMPCVRSSSASAPSVGRTFTIVRARR